MKINEGGFDPKLKEALEEIKPILRKYDCMAVMVLVSPTHSEFLNHIDASWSVMTFEHRADGGEVGIRFRTKREDWPSKEAQNKATEASTHALTTFIEWSRITNGAFRSVIQQLGKHMKIAWSTWQ